MPRPHKCRLIANQPAVTVFKPAGVPGQQVTNIEVGLDELEALRLADVEGLYHDAAAERMGLSRPTFGRLLAQARKKVATAIVSGNALLIQGGTVAPAPERVFLCQDCGQRFGEPFGTGRPAACPHCQSPQIRRVDDHPGRRRRGAGGGRGGRGHRDGRGRGRGRNNPSND